MINPEQKPNATPIFWCMWMAIISGLVIIYFFIGSGIKSSSSKGLWFLPIIPLCASVFIRLRILPRLSGVQMLPLFIVGLALAESCGILGVFIVSSMKQLYFALSLVALLLYIPIFASQRKENDDQL